MLVSLRFSSAGLPQLHGSGLYPSLHRGPRDIFQGTNGLYGPLSFRAMMWNEFHQQTFECGMFTCSFPSLDGRTISGTSVLEYYGYRGGQGGGMLAA